MPAVIPTGQASCAVRPATWSQRSAGGFWAERARINREVSLPAALQELHRAGNISYFAAAAERAAFDPRPPDVPALNDPYIYNIFDSDVYKWLEAVGYEATHGLDPELAEAAGAIIGLVAAAQREDGYLHTATQLSAGRAPFDEWRLGHELYCGGHLIQAGIAWYRAVGDERLLDVARRFARFVVSFVADADVAILPLHPGIEMALVELYRVDGNRDYLELARLFIDRRGYGSIGYWKYTGEYFLDDVPVRETTAIRGHAVMALFLLCGMVDVAVETADAALLAAAERQWHDMVSRKMYVTGGVGSRHHEESFGDAYELPPDRAYNETCAAVAVVMLSWRLLLATGRPKYADVLERVLYNAVLPGVSLDGRSFFYVNPLQVRAPDEVVSGGGCHTRAAWFECACCPPNLMRILATVTDFLATGSELGVQVHSLVSGTVAVCAAGQQRTIAVRSQLPGQTAVSVTVVDPGARSDEFTITVRIPSWSMHTTAWLVCPDGTRRELPVQAGEYLSVTRQWSAGSSIEITLDDRVSLAEADPRVDACLGRVALTRGPLVYCIEEIDLAGTRVADVRLDPDTVWTTAEDGPAGAVTLHGVGLRRTAPSPADTPRLSHDESPYRRLEQPSPSPPPPEMSAIELRAGPYYLWNNRGPTAMRVWLPRA